MTAERDEELAALLRRALSDEAEKAQPAGDGLSRIRRRVAARPSWRIRWLAPGLALAGAAAMIAGIAVLRSVLPGDGGTQLVPGARQGSAASLTVSASVAPTGPSATPTPGADPSRSEPTTTPPPNPSTGTPTGTPSGSGTTAVGDVPTVWPYASRREGSEKADADVRTGVHPRLGDPALTAVDFVGSFVGPEGLTATRLGAYPPGLRMLVSRDGRPVSTVYLLRVRTGDGAPYVVVGASRATIDPQDSLTISAPPAVGTEPLAVGGLLRRPDGVAAPSVTVQLREPGQDQPLARTSVLPVRSAGSATATWSAVLTPLRAPAATGVVAAWTADAGGHVLEFVAAATAR